MEEETKVDEYKFTVGEPVARTEIPEVKGDGASGKYAEVWEAVRKLPAGEWLPVTVGTPRMAFRLTQNAKNKNFWAKRRGLTVYISRKAE